MFDYIKIEGFRSFKNVELNLSPLSVLIGPNNGGKSNFLDLMALLRAAGRGQLDNAIQSRGGFDGVAFGFDVLADIHIEIRFKGDMFRPSAEPGETLTEKNKRDVRFKLGVNVVGVSKEELTEELTLQGRPTIAVMKRDQHDCTFRSLRVSKGEHVEEKKTLDSDSELAIFQVKDLNRYPIPYRISKNLQAWTLYRDINVGPVAPVRQPGLVRPVLRLSEDGTNLSSVLHSIQQQHPGTWEEIIELVHTAYPDFKTITFPPEGGDGKVILRWWERPRDREGVSANFLSDGTLKLLCLIAVLKSPDPAPLICIDEPEIGLHPDWIKLVAELLRDAATRTQVIVATHSPQIVAKLDPEQVIVAEKVEGATRLKRLEQVNLEAWLKDFNLSELWLAGHFGGRP